MEEQAVIEKIEDVAETVVPEVIETIEKFRTNPVLVATVAVVSLAAGAAAGYFVAKKRVGAQFDAMLDHEIAKTKEFYETQQRLNKEGEFETVEKAALRLVPQEEREAVEAFKSYQGKGVDVVETEEELEVTVTEVEQDGEDVVETQVVTRNIFVNGSPIDEDAWDQDVEESMRTPKYPYIITVEEFNENEPDHEQLQVTFYEKDGVLCDDSDGVINNIDGNVGEGNMLRFGHGSKDRNIVYIRNERRQVDYEVARDERSYTAHVLGMDDEEDEKETPRKFRGGDD